VSVDNGIDANGPKRKRFEAHVSTATYSFRLSV
jgi:hypothetical protein